MNKEEIIKEFREKFKDEFIGEPFLMENTETFWLSKLKAQNQDLLNEIKEYIREKSLLTPEDKAEIIGYLEGIRIRPKQLLK